MSSITGAVDVPKLSLRAWHGATPRRGVIHYESSEQRDIPHVVKFSGGRSSGLMLLILLENGLLKAERGDVVLFTNTSAEHPATYDFVRKMKCVTERAGIPFFLTQLQTVETVIGGEWRRRRTYRLASARPFSARNPWGYNDHGEVFEDAIASTGILPSVHTRICTTLMKMFVTREFLADWFGGAKGIRQQGHKGEALQVDIAPLYREHLKNNGKMSFEEFGNRYQVFQNRASFRPAQKYRNFTRAYLAPRPSTKLKPNVFGDRCELFGEHAASYITFLGFRFGEDARYQRMKQRNNGEITPGHDTHPPGEVSYAPLFDLGIDQDKVLKFWGKQPSKIRPRLPTDMNLSNCVYCFLKGTRALEKIESQKKEFERTLPPSLRDRCGDTSAPSSLDWWIRFEDTYKRKANKKNSNGQATQTFGMFGLKDMDYRLLKKHAATNKTVIRATSLPPTLNCECTD